MMNKKMGIINQQINQIIRIKIKIGMKGFLVH